MNYLTWYLCVGGVALIWGLISPLKEDKKQREEVFEEMRKAPYTTRSWLHFNHSTLDYHFLGMANIHAMGDRKCCEKAETVICGTRAVYLRGDGKRVGCHFLWK